MPAVISSVMFALQHDHSGWSFISDNLNFTDLLISDCEDHLVIKPY